MMTVKERLLAKTDVGLSGCWWWQGCLNSRGIAQQLASREEDLRVERASHAATKGKLTKVQKRVTHGVCPCCNRTFANVQRHMKSQHADKVAEAGT